MMKGRQGHVIPPVAEPCDLSRDNIRQQGGVAERFSFIDIGQMHLNHRAGQYGQGIPQHDTGMGEPPGVDNDPPGDVA